MSKVICDQSVSLDGFSAGPNQSLDNPLGEGGMRVHGWMFATRTWREAQGEAPGSASPDDAIVKDIMTSPGVGAYVMGRNMFGPIRGDWDMSWRGWWGEDPPYHAPVFVLTHHAREPIPMQGGTTFYFVTDGVESAFRQARDAAGGKDIRVAGGASTVQQAIRAGELDELRLHIAPFVLGQGERLLDNVGDPKVTPVSAITSPAVTHLTYRFER